MPSAASVFSLPVPVRGLMGHLKIEDIPPDGASVLQNYLVRDNALVERPAFINYGASMGQRQVGLVYYQMLGGGDRVVMGTTGGWRKLSAAATWTDITGTPLTGADLDLIVFRTFQKAGATWLLGTNGANTMKKWDGNAATYVDVGGTPPRCKTMMTLFNRVLVGNLLSGSLISPAAVTYSAFNDFDTWGNTNTLLVDTPGAIVAMREMGNQQGVIYKSDAIYMVFASSDTEPYRYELKQAGISGPQSANSVVTLPDGSHLYIAFDGSIMRFDGVRVESVSPATQAFFRLNNYAGADLETYGSHAFYDTRWDEAWFFYGPAAPGGAIVIKYPSMAAFPQRFDVFGGAYFSTASAFIPRLIGAVGDSRFVLFGTTTGQTKIEDQTFESGASSIAPVYQSGLFDLGDPRGFKTILETEHLCIAPASSTAQVATPFVGNYGSVTTYGTSENIPTTAPYVTGHRITGRRVGLQLSSLRVSGIPWKWYGAVSSIAPRGQR